MFDRRLFLVVLACGCAHKPLAGADLDRVSRPAFISRIEEGAGPKITVFRDDDSYKPKLKRLDSKEADRRLKEKLTCAMNRFEISDRLRATTMALLPRERPWPQTVEPVQVARALESFLVEEVPANAPDLDLLRPLGVDGVVEFVVESYGMRSDKGRAGLFLEGHGRMVLLKDGHEAWYRAFRVDQIDAGEPGQDPFAVAKEIRGDKDAKGNACSESKGTLYRTSMETLIDAVAAQFAKDLSPPDRRGGPAVPTGPENTSPDSTNKTGRENEENPL